MPRLLKFRLSAMMFLEYFVPGATLPILSYYLKNYLGFEPYQVGQVLAMPAIAAFIAPFVVSHVADRYLSSERLLALCHLLAAGVMLLLSKQTEYRAFLGLYFVYGLVFTPTFGLTNTVALHHVTDAKRDFGGIRMWGTAGWVAVAWLFGYLWLKGGDAGRLPHALYVSALASCVFGLYALTLPPSNVREERPASVMYWKALKVFARPSLMLLCALTFVSSMLHQVYYYGMSPFLNSIGFENRHIMPAMSIGQISEVLVMAMLGVCLARISMKRAMIIALLAQAFRYSLFAHGSPALLILFGISMHGICYTFFFTTAYLYVDQHSTPQTRAGAQQLFTIIIAGFGTLGGHLSAGYLAQLLTTQGTANVRFAMFWLIPSAAAVIVAGIMALLFREEQPVANVTVILPRAKC